MKAEQVTTPLSADRLPALYDEYRVIGTLLFKAEALGEIPFDVATQLVESANRIIDRIDAP